MRHARHDAGFTLLETVITIALAATIFAVYASVVASVIFLRRTQYEVQAATLLQEELETLRTLPYTELIARTNGALLGIPLQRGSWTVQSVGGSNAVTNGATPTASVEETGLLIAPGNYREDATFRADVRVASTSPSGWGGGIVFRYRDAENHYRWRFTAGGIALDRVYRGTRTTLWSQSTAHSTNIWYVLEVVASGSSLTLKRNGTTLATVSDSTFTGGDLGVLSLNNGTVAADNVTVIEGGVTTTYAFTSDAVGALPDAWVRRSYVDLPTGTGTLTIANYLGETTLKQATVTVTWRDGLFTKSRSASTLISD
jgi:prepilin-type N-terminal cleavage/methylation domain-containing protein